VKQYTSIVAWSREGARFVDNRYCRGHRWIFDGGIEVAASASPHNVPTPLSVEAAVDPEEAFVASLSSCHMLWFLSIAARRGFVVESYRDEAVGILEENAEGLLAMTRVTLRPLTSFAGDALPSSEELIELHEAAHEECFIARSVRTIVRCEPTACLS